jgi:hypothetical protein
MLQPTLTQATMTPVRAGGLSQAWRVLLMALLAGLVGAALGAAPLANWADSGPDDSLRAALRPGTAVWLRVMNKAGLTAPYAALRGAAVAVQDGAGGT